MSQSARRACPPVRARPPPPPFFMRALAPARRALASVESRRVGISASAACGAVRREWGREKGRGQRHEAEAVMRAVVCRGEGAVMTLPLASAILARFATSMAI
jgi:hypothetical protein